MRKCLACLLAWLTACGDHNAATDPLPQNRTVLTARASADLLVDKKKATYVGPTACRSCHASQYESWRGSHHDLAMQEANDQTVLADFDNATFDYFATTSTFYKKQGKFFVKTDGPDGRLTDYAIAYTFGVYPLQQYLIEFPGGKLQALNVVWDSRDKSAGGQRWFHLYPDEHIKHDDELHWTGINQNWNFMCADCHSTNLQKRYDPGTRTYDTIWSQMNVGCEACHGPASNHLAWAAKPEAVANKGFAKKLVTGRDVLWKINQHTGNANPQPSISPHSEVDTCARCHSRRSTLFADAQPQHALLDDYRPILLTDSLYHVDGQVNGEAFVYGSFAQSKMYQAGVTCSNCHDPHGLKPRAEGSNVCAQCHSTEKYFSPSHHLHAPDSEGAQCVNCHMPAKNIMVVDARRDHSFRVPRPDLSHSLGVPNACNGCHTDKSASWAAQQLEKQFGKPPADHYAEALHAAITGEPGAGQSLANIVADKTAPVIIRASATALLTRYLSRETAPLLQSMAYDQALVGFALADNLDNIPAQYRAAFAVPLLYDQRRVTRALAANALVGISLEQFPEEVRDRYARALDEHIASGLFNADRPESLTNLAGIHASTGQLDKAVEFYRNAIEIAPFYTPAYVNFADFYRRQNKESEASEILREGLTVVRDASPIHFALGLSLVRQQKTDVSLEHFRIAAESSSSTSRYHYVYAIALNSQNRTQKALGVLEQALVRYPRNPELLSALAGIYRENGNESKAVFFEKQFGDP